MLLFVFSEFHKIKFGHLVEICFWLNLEVKGLKHHNFVNFSRQNTCWNPS